jgi:energy-coupling factor transport system substrate-specific component
MNTNQLKAKDLITIAIFTVVMVLVFFAGSMTIGMIPMGYPFLVAVIAVPGGIVWAFMRVKVPKRFAILIQSVITAAIFYLIGSGWFLALGFLSGGLLAEVITGAGKYKRFALNTAGYAAFIFCVHMGAFLITVVARDYYYNYGVTNGMGAEWLDVFMGFMSLRMMLLTGTLTIVSAVAGMLLGRVMLKKHFAKAGVM